MEARKLEPSPIFDKLSEILAGRATVSAFALFGSRARGDNFDESDYDLLVVDTRNLSSIFLERIVIDEESIDLVHVPLNWLTKQIPYELDQMIYESIILADRDGILTSAQKWIKNCNYESMRIAGRVGEVLLKSDVLLSRASSALNRLDYESCIVHSKMARIEASKVLLELSKIPYQPSRFAELLKSTALEINLDHIIPPAEKTESAKRCLKEILETVARSAKIYRKQSSESIEHTWAITYFTNKDFISRTIKLLDNLITENRFQDASLYAQIISYRTLETYQLITKLDTMADYVTILRQMKGKADSESSKLYEVVKILYDIYDQSKQQAVEALKMSRDYSFKLKQLKTYMTTKTDN